jgi:hypothetical protein
MAAAQADPQPSARFRHSANSKATEVDEGPGFISAFDLEDDLSLGSTPRLHTRPDTDADLIFQPAETGDKDWRDITPLVISNSGLYNSYYVIRIFDKI